MTTHIDPRVELWRRRVPAHVRKQVYAFYGTDCVICGQSTTHDLAHIDENRSSSVFENVCPLCPTANEAIERDKLAPFAGEINLVNLLARAQDHQACGRLACAYACYRLLAHLAEKSVDMELALQAAASCIAVLRPVDQPALVRRAVLDIGRVASTAGKRVSPLARAEALNQVGLVIYDQGNPMAAMAFYRLALSQLRRPGEAFDGRDRDLRQSRSLQHCASASALTTCGQRGRSFALGYLEESCAIAVAIRDGHRLCSALTIKAAVHHRFGELTESAKLLHQAWELRQKANPWTRADLCLLWGEFYLSTGQRSRGVRKLQEAANVLAQYQMRPEGGVFDRSPAQVLGAIGEPVSPMRKPEPSGLSEDELRSAFQALCS